MTLTALLSIFIAVTTIQISYYCCFIVFAFSKRKSAKKITQNLPISVLVCAKNEAENLIEFLPSIVHQNYPKFEIILINDASTDDTLGVMEKFRDKHSFIKIVNVQGVEAFWGNKKYALTLGIKATKYEHLLFTDADCKPVSKNWIRTMAQHFSDEKSIVLGYGKYKKQKKSLVNLLVCYETLLTAIQYFSYAKFKIPYMGVGRNLAYRKSVFFNIKGFYSHMKIRSGDDDLFIQEAANNYNTAICLSKDSFTISKPPKTFKDWIHQKRRHISTAFYYKTHHKILLGLFYLSKLLFYALAITLLFVYPYKIILIFILLYFLVQYIVVGFSAKKLQEMQILPFLPVLEIFLLLFQFTIFTINRFSKPVYWK